MVLQPPHNLGEEPSGDAGPGSPEPGGQAGERGLGSVWTAEVREYAAKTTAMPTVKMDRSATTSEQYVARGGPPGEARMGSPPPLDTVI